MLAFYTASALVALLLRLLLLPPPLLLLLQGHTGYLDGHYAICIVVLLLALLV
jgi:hypothetical protein